MTTAYKNPMMLSYNYSKSIQLHMTWEVLAN